MKDWKQKIRRWIGILMMISVVGACIPEMGAFAAEEVVLTTYLDITHKDAFGHYLKGQAMAHHITPAAGETTFITREWYVVDSDLTIPDRLEVYGDSVNIIIADGAKLTVKNGISIRGDAPNGTWTKLTIWAQSDATRAGTNPGRIVATSTLVKEKGGAGIGASYGSSKGDSDTPAGELVINGGIIYAEGADRSAGIGGSNYRGMRAITINGGQVDARGFNYAKEYAANAGGAGIGGGTYSPAFPITIAGGIIQAYGGASGAGIGNGTNVSGTSDNPAVTCHITGSADVTAKGGFYGAGIGGGYRSCYGGILIDGSARVTATGVHGGAGIGGGGERGNMGIVIGGSARVWAYARNRYAEPQHAYSWSEEAGDWLARTENGKIVAEKTADNGYYEEETGAGIGGGSKAAGYDVTIRDSAQVCAWSAGWGAGIGGGGAGGDLAEGRTITIEGNPKVLAFGGMAAAGIGAGFSGNQIGKIIITGGDVIAYGGFDKINDHETSGKTAAGIGGGKESFYGNGGEGGPVTIMGGRVRVMAGGTYACAIGKGYNDREEGSITLGDNMWVRWSNDIGKYFDHENQYTDNNRSDGSSHYGFKGAASEPDDSHAPWLDYRNVPRTVSQESLQPSLVGSRVSDIHHSRYVVIEKCPHGTPRYTDLSPELHQVLLNCPYCKFEGAIYMEHHRFDSETHTCACGHQAYQATFYAEMDAETPFHASDYTAAGLQYRKPDHDPSKEGFLFTGWYEKDTNGQLKAEAYNFNRPVEGGLRLYAKWNPIPDTTPEYIVTFHGNTAATQKSITVQAGNYIREDEVPQPAAVQDQIFDGWFEKSGELFSDHAFDFSQPIVGNVDLYEKWTERPRTHTVTFHPENGESNIQSTVEDGAPVTPPANPAKEGMTFSYWIQKDTQGVEFANPYNFSEPVTGNLDLYAHYDLPVYGVYFDPDGGVFPDGAFDTPGWNRRYVVKGQPVTRPLDPVKEGWEFVRWELNGEAYNFLTPVTDSIKLVAHWEMHGVDFDSIVPPSPEEGFVYDGMAHPLLKKPGSVKGGRMYYALGTRDDFSSLSETIPAAVNAGTYYVWYIVPGDGIHEQKYGSFEVKISPRPLTITAKSQILQAGEEIRTGTDQVVAEGLVRNEEERWAHVLTGITLEASSGDEGKIIPSDAEIARYVMEDGGIQIVTDQGAAGNYQIRYVPGRLTWIPAVYHLVSAQGIVHTLGDPADAVILVRRSVRDDLTHVLFTGLTVDGKTVAPSSYIPEKGSLKLTLKASWLNTLAEGEHPATLLFQDGQAEVTLTILPVPAEKPKTDAPDTPEEKPKTDAPDIAVKVPKTGDNAAPVAWLLLILLGLIGLVGARFLLSRKS